MILRLTLFDAFPYWLTPASWWGWGLLLVLAGILAGWLLKRRASCRRWTPGQRKRGLLLLALTPLTVLFAGLEFAAATPLPWPGVPQGEAAATAALFSALPWMLAAGWLGPCGAIGIAFFSGLLRLFWDTHSLFQPLVLALEAGLFALAINQPYRGRIYHWLRRPLLAGVVLLPTFSAFFVLTNVSMTPDTLAVGLDYAFSNVGLATLAFGLEVLFGGLLAEIIRWMAPEWWQQPKRLQPSPMESSLSQRFLLGSGAIVALVLVSLLVGDWIVAGRAARLMLRDRMQSTAHIAAESVPFFLETGQNLVLRMAAAPEMRQAEGEELTYLLAEQMLLMPYFDELLVYDVDGNLLAAYPPEVMAAPSLQLEELNGMPLALAGVTAQVYTTNGRPGRESGQVSFLAAITDENGTPRRVLIGRSGLDLNPITRPLLNSLSNVSVYGGTGYLLDEHGRVLFDSASPQSMYPYPGERPEQESFFTDTAPDGTRRLVYYQPAPGRDWSVVLVIPARASQQLALNIAAPLLGMVLLLGAAALALLQMGLRSVTTALQQLAREADTIARGDLEHPLRMNREDELGQLARAFEQMRHSLQRRMNELNRLLQISQEMASSLEMERILQPVLEAIMSIGGVTSARVVLAEETLPEVQVELPRVFGAGDGRYAYLDNDILNLVRGQQYIVELKNPRRAPQLHFPPGQPIPGYVLALQLAQGRKKYGVLWVACQRPRGLNGDEVRFISTLAADVTLAVANAVLFLQAEVGRQHLEAILTSTPDPVLVTDANQRLLLVNPAAAETFGFSADQVLGRSVSEVFSHQDLVALLQGRTTRNVAEIRLEDGRVYLATASAIRLEARQVGQVCILRDVTYLKQMDEMKSDFVATVSHDLRSPLTLMRGYATMLEMVGELNDQQRTYLSKIVLGVENMSRLVNNLLDLGRIEAGVGLNREKVLVRDLMEKVVGALQLYASQKSINLDLQLGEDVPAAVEADPALLYQAVYNLVENAIKYTPEGGRVTVRAQRQGEQLVFAIQDTGIGISPADQKRLFEKFFRSSQREARAQKGTGLGLAIVRSIAERHGGRVWVQSKLGEGSTFFLAVPLRGG